MPDSPAAGTPRRIGPYEVLEEIGRGGMGAVYRARDTRLDRIVALKVLLGGSWASPDAVDRFQREAARGLTFSFCAAVHPLLSRSNPWKSTVVVMQQSS